MKNKSLIIAGSLLTGVGSAVTLISGLAYYFKYKQGKLTDSEWFNILVASFTAISAARDGTARDAIEAVNASSRVQDAAMPPSSISDDIKAVNDAAFVYSGNAAVNAVLDSKYKELSFTDSINFYKYWITYYSTIISNLDANDAILSNLISKLKALETASKKERDILYTLVSLFGAVGPAIVIAGVPTLVTGLVRNKIIK